MGISELRQLEALSQDLYAADSFNAAENDLLENGIISRSDVRLAQLVRKHCDASLDQVLSAEGLTDETTLLLAQARRAGASLLSPETLSQQICPELGYDPRHMIRHGLAPLRDPETGVIKLATSDADHLSRLRHTLPKPLRRAAAVIAPRGDIQQSIANINRDMLTNAAQSRVPAAESCRSWSVRPHRRLAMIAAGAMVCLALTFLFPTVIFAIFTGWAALTLLVAAGLKSAAFVTRLLNGGPLDRSPPPSTTQKLPKVSILVPLFRETEIAHALITRLTRLTYPKCLLDVILILEESDTLTQQTLAEIDLPPWMRAIIVPKGQPQTKPRAMNYALDFCNGDIIGIFDAEDAPDPDQITTVARHFQAAAPDVACLQGVLDYYNPRQTWLARCFTIEYAAWFRVILPGMAQLGLAIPLGGTTLYFRREVLERLGGWDAHNVTEDADLGFRLARHGYRTEMVGTVTREEANCRAWPWVKQRSRWLKGYMTTYLVHMGRPRLLYRQLGARKFWGFQAHSISAVSQFLLAPFLWSFWLILLSLPHPLQGVLPDPMLWAFSYLFLTAEMLSIVIYATAVTGPDHRHLIAWVPTMHLYTPLGTIAAYKALYELITVPFYWDKTSHGHSLQSMPPKSERGFDLA